MRLYKYFFFSAHIAINLADSNKTKYQFKTIKDDIYDTHYIELENGLKIYLVKNDKKPTVEVRAYFNVGSKNDPQDNTGLAHYFEHLMSNGTTKIGSLDYEKEKPYLDKIEDLFEKLKLEKDKKKREKIIKEIDDNSLKASKFSTNREFDRILQSLGCSNINAFTSKDVTCYHYTIPKNNLDKSLNVLAEQLFNPVIRRFSTELQVIYEEYVRLKEDSNKICSQKVFKELCKNHPYSIHMIGKEEHLKNPTIKGIKEFHNKYYNTNNLTLLFVGDIDYDSTVEIIEKYFGKLKKKEIPKNNFPDIKLPEKTAEFDILTENRNYGLFVFPIKIKEAKDYYKIYLITTILNSYLNSLNLEKQVNDIFVNPHFLKDISFINIYFEPLDRNSLKKTKEIVLNKMKNFCTGKDNSHSFNYVINDIIYKTRNEENIKYITELFEQIVVLSNFDDIEKSGILSNKLIKNLKKQDCELFVKDLLSKPYYIINKNKGNRDYDKIDKIKVSNMILNNDKKSEYFKNIEKIKSEDIEPAVLDYSKSVKNYKYNDNVNFYYIKKNNKKIFKINIRFNCGILNDKNVRSLNYFLQFSKNKNMNFNEFYEKLNELGSSIYFDTCENYVLIELYGISEHLDKTIKLVSDYIINIKFDNNSVSNGIQNYLNNELYYGLNKIQFKNYKNYIIDSIEIKQFTKEKLKNLLNKILSAKCDVLFSTDLEPKQFIDKIINSKLLNKCKNKYEIKGYEYKDYDKNKIFIHNINGAQNIKCYILCFLNKFNVEDFSLIDVYNKYYQNIYFDEIREKNGLTYNQYWHVFADNLFYNKDILWINFDCQPNKFISAFNKTLGIFEFNKNKDIFKLSYDNVKITKNSKRFMDMNILNCYLNDMEYGVDVSKTSAFEISKKNIDSITFDNLINFHNVNIKNAPKIIYIVGSLEDIDVNYLSKYGEIKKLK